MSMLAEPRRKQKLSADPRNLNWKNDSAKIGHKLMEKMGWSEGKGLGSNEHGMKDNLEVTYKSDTRGLGCSARQATSWVPHQDDFNAVLAGLSGAAPGDASVSSSAETTCQLADASKKSKGKAHSVRFCKSKDLSQVHEHDLGAIFGKRKRKRSTSKSDGHNAVDHEPSPEELTGKIVISSSSVSEYFAQKMARLKSLRSSGTSSQESGEEIVRDEDCPRPCFQQRESLSDDNPPVQLNHVTEAIPVLPECDKSDEKSVQKVKKLKKSDKSDGVLREEEFVESVSGIVPVKKNKKNKRDKEKKIKVSKKQAIIQEEVTFESKQKDCDSADEVTTTSDLRKLKKRQDKKSDKVAKVDNEISAEFIKESGKKRKKQRKGKKEGNLIYNYKSVEEEEAHGLPSASSEDGKIKELRESKKNQSAVEVEGIQVEDRQAPACESSEELDNSASEEHGNMTNATERSDDTEKTEKKTTLGGKTVPFKIPGVRKKVKTSCKFEKRRVRRDLKKLDPKYKKRSKKKVSKKVSAGFPGANFSKVEGYGHGVDLGKKFHWSQTSKKAVQRKNKAKKEEMMGQSEQTT